MTDMTQTQPSLGRAKHQRGARCIYRDMTASELDRAIDTNAELLAALTGLLETIEKHTTTNKSGFAANAVAWWKQQARAAIAKAERK